MRPIAITGVATDVGGSAGLTDAELLAPVVDAALAASGLDRDDVAVVCTAGSELLNGVVGSMMGAFDAFPGWPPRQHSHHEGDGAFALHEAWIRLLAGEGDAALVCAYSRPLADEPERPLALQLDPYLVAPLGPNRRQLAALQAHALLGAALRDADCPRVCSGAVAVVLASGALTGRAASRPAWIRGIEQEIECHALGARDLTRSPSTRHAATRLGIPGTRIDVAELHAPFRHQKAILVEALDADIGRVNPSGGALLADPVMATGLIRVGEAAEAILRGEAEHALGHATSGPCLQHNLICRLDASMPPGAP